MLHHFKISDIRGFLPPQQAESCLLNIYFKVSSENGTRNTLTYKYLNIKLQVFWLIIKKLKLRSVQKYSYENSNNLQEKGVCCFSVS